MEEKYSNFILKPVFWRLALYHFLPFIIGSVGMDLILRLAHHQMIDIMVYLLELVFVLLFDIVLTQGTTDAYEVILSDISISGISGRPFWGREEFSLDDLNRSSLVRERTLRNLLGGHWILRSGHKKKIIIIPYIYEQSSLEKLKFFLEQISQRQAVNYNS